jgi:hypothetical protein
VRRLTDEPTIVLVKADCRLAAILGGYPRSATNYTETELAETHEWIVQVCMERHIAAGMTKAEAREIVEEAMIAPFRFRLRTLDGSDTANGM